MHGRIHAFVATRNGRPVGRIAAIVNESHNRYHGDRTGFFGFFECVDDEDVAKTLIDHAAKVLRDGGLTSMRGPYNPSINDECGLLVEGFDTPPSIGLVWNPPFYERLLLSAGLQPARNLVGFELPLARLQMPERIARLAARVAKRSKLRLRPIDMKNLERDLGVVHVVYNHTLGRNWGFVPISMEDLLMAANDLRAIADPAMIMIAEQDGEPAGVALSLPNFNELLGPLKRTPRWLRLPHLLWLMKTRRIRTGRQVVYGIVPKFRDRGLHAWLLHEQFSRARSYYTDAELGWIEENNSEILSNAVMMGGSLKRRWRIYEKPL